MADLAEELVSATVQAIQANAERLGLTWQIRPATVSDGTSPSAVSAICDGDTVSIGMVSTIGPLAAGIRVYVLQVPPSGHFIIGLVAPASVIAGYMYCDGMGFIASTAGGEVAVPAGSWTSEGVFSFSPGYVYQIEIAPGLNPSTANALWARVRVREGSASTTGAVLMAPFMWLYAGAANSGFSSIIVGYVQNPTVSMISTQLSLTIEKIGGGAGSVQIYGGEQLAPTYVIARRYCLISEAITLAASAVAL